MKGARGPADVSRGTIPPKDVEPRPGERGLGLESEGWFGPGMAAEHQYPRLGGRYGGEGAQGEGQCPKRDVSGGWSRVLVVTETENLDLGAARRAGRLPEKGPALGPGLQESRCLPGAQKREDKPRRAVPGADVEERALLDPGKGRKHFRYEPRDPGFGVRRAREVDPGVPGAEEVEVGLEGRCGFGREAETGDRGAVDPPHFPSSPSDAMVTRRPAPSPTL
jgi:hypothetical protein